jgi:hypothetical protein
MRTPLVVAVTGHRDIVSTEVASITIYLDPGCEVPAARGFKRPELVRDVLRERGRYVSGALTIVRAWIVAGRPKTPCKSLAGYDHWSDLCRQPILADELGEINRQQAGMVDQTARWPHREWPAVCPW